MPEIVAPYVISQDMEHWRDGEFSLDRQNLDTFRTTLEQDLSELGKRVEWVEYETLSQGISRLALSTQLPKISLDRYYVDPRSNFEMLDITRGTDSTFGTTSYVGRMGSDTLSSQFDGLGQKFYGQEVALVDDVLFSGEMAGYIVSELKKRKVRVATVMVGIAIGNNSINQWAEPVELESVVQYDEVEDELCERDFTTHDNSGRILTDIDARALYWIPKPFSDHEKMASLPATNIQDFYLKSLERNVAAFGANTIRKSLDDVFGKEMITRDLNNLT